MFGTGAAVVTWLAILVKCIRVNGMVLPKSLLILEGVRVQGSTGGTGITRIEIGFYKYN